MAEPVPREGGQAPAEDGVAPEIWRHPGHVAAWVGGALIKSIAGMKRDRFRAPK